MVPSSLSSNCTGARERLDAQSQRGREGAGQGTSPQRGSTGAGPSSKAALGTGQVTGMRCQHSALLSQGGIRWVSEQASECHNATLSPTTLWPVKSDTGYGEEMASTLKDGDGSDSSQRCRGSAAGTTPTSLGIPWPSSLNRACFKKRKKKKKRTGFESLQIKCYLHSQRPTQEFKSHLFHFCSSSLLMHLGKQWNTALPLTWKAHMEFPGAWLWLGMT